MEYDKELQLGGSRCVENIMIYVEIYSLILYKALLKYLF